MLNTVDLFCGCGGMSLGLQNAGYNIISAYDNWDPAVSVYQKNFVTHTAYKADLSDERAQEVISGQRPELIIGGPPCQDFSDAGPRNESLGRAGLTLSYADIVIKSMPRYFIMENVCRITKTTIYKEVVKRFKEAGYGLSPHILDASYCGVPQARRRFFLVGGLGAPDDFLSETIQASLSDKPMSIHDYLGDALGVEYYFRIPRSYTRRAVFSIYEPCVTIRGVDRPIPKTYVKHPSDPVEIGPKVRALTVLERSYLQTFPRDFVFEGTKSDLNQMIGNAVPVKLAEFVATCLSRYLNNC